jgi:allantoicase
VDEALIDTAFYKGNFPESCELHGVYIADGSDPQPLDGDSIDWRQLLPRTKLTADSEHRYSGELDDRGPYSHVRLTIHPDGGVARMRIFGTPVVWSNS